VAAAAAASRILLDRGIRRPSADLARIEVLLARRWASSPQPAPYFLKAYRHRVPGTSAGGRLQRRTPSKRESRRGPHVRLWLNAFLFSVARTRHSSQIKRSTIA